MMHTIFEITCQKIELLNAVQLTYLLNLLLHVEAASNGIPTSGIAVSQKIDVKDGGEDGRIAWTDGPERTSRLPRRLCMFQCKTTAEMSELDFANSNLQKAIKSADFDGEQLAEPVPLKAQVTKVLDGSGAYIFFYSHQLTQSQIDLRIVAIRRALRLSGRVDWESAVIDIYDANKISNWCNEHWPAAIQVLSWLSQEVPLGIQNWDSWSRDESHQNFRFVNDQHSASLIETITKHLSVPRKAARILGLPGLGKSRLAYEALSSDEHKNHVLYVDCTFRPSQLSDAIRQFADRGNRAIIVADNCDQELCESLAKHVKRSASRLSLLTIDLNPDEQGSEEVIVLEPRSDALIKDLVKQIFGETLQDATVEKVVALAQGFPKMAWLVAEAHRAGKVDSASLKDNLLFKRLVWGRANENEDALEVIKACSLFTRVGYSGNVEDERKIVAEKFAGLSDDRFYKVVQDFLRRGIIQQRGDFIRVVPRPLAIRLASDWWYGCTPTRANNLINDKEVPDKLLASMCDQIKMLDYLPKVKELTKTLCGQHGPFGQAEVLNSERGSLLFRAFVEVSPEDTITALVEAFQNWDRTMLLTVGPGRRGLVRALEKICFWETSFSKGAKMLLRLAAAENEDWSNNATGQFEQLFQLYLPGTMAPLSARASLLKDVLSNNCTFSKKSIVKAATSAFRLGHYSRTGGVEQQGSRQVQSDYQPRTGNEIISYWSECLQVLLKIAQSDQSELRETAIAGLEEVIYPCVIKGVLAPLLSVLSTVMEERQRFWPGALKKLDQALRDDENPRDAEEQALIDSLIELLGPRNVRDRLTQWISEANWDYLDRDSNGNVVDLSEQKTIELGTECAQSWPSWSEHLSQLVVGPQKNAYLFGKTLGRDFVDASDFIQAVIGHLRRYPDGSANPLILSGILTNQQENGNLAVVTNVLETLAESVELHNYLIRVTASIRPTVPDLERCLLVFDHDDAPVELFRLFSLGNVIDHLPEDDICKFVERLGEQKEPGAMAGLAVLHMYCYQKESRWETCRASFRRLVVAFDLEKQCESIGHSDQHMWSEDLINLLRSSDSELVNYLVNEIIRVCESLKPRIFYQFDKTFRTLLKVLLSESHRDSAWPPLANALLSAEWPLSKHLEWLLGHFLKEENAEQDLLSILPPSFLLNWAKQDRRAVILLAKQVKLYTRSVDGNEVSMNPFFLELLDLDSETDELLSALSTNVWSYAGWGSMTPHYRGMASFGRSLAEHRRAEIAEWADRLQRGAESQLAESSKRDEENDAGIMERF